MKKKPDFRLPLFLAAALIVCLIWIVGSGEWRVENGKWKVESGESRVESAKRSILPPSSLRHPPSAIRHPPSTPQGPRIAIVLDDWGYNLDSVAILKELKDPVTLAVLPHLPYSKAIADDAHAWGHEIILHMPMEPKRQVPLEKFTILTTMPDAEVRRLIETSIAGIPHAAGVSNHQGSAASEDTRVMKSVLETVRGHGLFYLDSMTSDTSKTEEAARDLGFGPILKRDVFLDNVRTEAAIQARLDELKEIAINRGFAIGIGHDEPITLEIIKRNIPELEKEGIKLVKVSDVLAD